MENDGEYYKQKIIEMVNEMDNIDFLFKIYHYIIPKYMKEKGAVDYLGSLYFSAIPAAIFRNAFLLSSSNPI